MEVAGEVINIAAYRNVWLRLCKYGEHDENLTLDELLAVELAAQGKFYTQIHTLSVLLSVTQCNTNASVR